MLFTLAAACDGGSGATSSDDRGDNPISEQDFDAEAHFRGKTITFIIGTEVGGGHDYYARLVARHLGEHIPGNPRIIPQNMPGGAHTITLQYMLEEAEADGYTIAAAEAKALEKAVGDPTITWDPAAFNYLGDIFPEPSACIFRTDQAETFDDLREQPVKVGATTESNGTSYMPEVMNQFLGTQMDVVTGYASASDIGLAFERGEVGGYCSSFGSILESHDRGLDEGDAEIIMYVSAEPLGAQFDALPDEKWFASFAEDEQTSELMGALGAATRGVHKTHFAPPDTPDEIVTVLREAWDAAVDDPELQAEAERNGRVLAPISGEQVDERIAEALELPDTLKELLRPILVGE